MEKLDTSKNKLYHCNYGQQLHNYDDDNIDNNNNHNKRESQFRFSLDSMLKLLINKKKVVRMKK